ncbi:KfrA protein (fragment) (plasmid) [Acidithiobacillus ferrivorans]|uniref:KfrA n=1 Tax=Acidithiobacillus ferrivorans TaxID=160808 RepID=A0A060UTN8_9PROT
MASQEEIWAAADALVKAGGRPTLAAVRKAVGGGSFTTISEAMGTWRTRQAIAEPVREPAPVAVAQQAAVLASELWAQALAIAHERLQADREVLEAARVDMARERSEAVELADLLAGELDQLRAEQKAAQMLLTEKDEEISHWRGEAALMREKAALLEGKVAGLEQALAQINVRMIPVMGTRGD